MKFLKKLLLWLAGIFLVIYLLLLAFDATYLIRAVRIVYFNGHKTAFLDDYKYFDNDTIRMGEPQPWAISSQYNKAPLSKPLRDLHKKTNTVAFLVIKNDSILHESYYEGYEDDSPSNSFSMAKSIVSAALGKAVMEGKIKSLEQPVSDFFPQFRSGTSGRMTVGDLSSMSSGLNWDENYYSPFSITTRAYFDENLDSLVLGLKGVDQPGHEFKYLSGNTQLLALVIEKATGQKLHDYISRKFWKPMGAEHPALWQTDRKNGTVKAYCCIASNARDFARFGKLFLNHGNWNGQQLLDSSFVTKSVTPRFADAPQYGYGWWLFEHKGRSGYYMRGHLGQYTIVIPEEKLIIVRLGRHHIRSTAGSPHSDDFWIMLDQVTRQFD